MPENLSYCVQGQGHSETLQCQLMSVWTISFELLNLLLPNLVLKDWFAVSKVMVTMKASYGQIMTLYYVS